MPAVMTTMKMKMMMMMMMMMLTVLFPAAGSLHPGASSLHCHRVHVQVCFSFHQGFRSGLCQRYSINGGVNDCKYSVNYQWSTNVEWYIFRGNLLDYLRQANRWASNVLAMTPHHSIVISVRIVSIHWIGRIMSLVYFPAGWCLNILLYEDV